MSRSSPLQLSRLDLWMLLLLFGLISFLYLPFLVGEAAFCFDDFAIWYAPYRLMIDASWAQGQLAQWEPFVGLGYPLISNPAASALNPLNLLALLMGGGLTGLHRLLIFHLMLGGGFAYLLARSLHLRPEAALLGALAFALSGPLNAYIQENAYHVMAMAWLPASLWLFLRSLSVERRGWIWAAWSGAAMGMMMYGGEPQVWYFNAFSLGAVALTHQRRGRAFLYLGLIIGVALLIAWAQISATLSNLSSSARGVSSPITERMAFSTHPIHLLSLLFPYPGGVMFPENSLWANGWLDSYRYWIHSFYLGLGTLLFAFLNRWSRLSLALWGALIFFAWMALGRFGGLYALADGVIPGMGLFRYPEKWAAGMSLPLSLLGAMGAERLFQGEVRQRIALLISFTGLLALALIIGAGSLESLIAEVPQRYGDGIAARGVARLQADGLHALTILGGLSLALYFYPRNRRFGFLILGIGAFDLIRVASIPLVSAPPELYTEPGPLLSHLQKVAPYERVRRLPKRPFVRLPPNSEAFVEHQARTRITGGLYSFSGQYRSISIIGPPLDIEEGALLDAALEGPRPIEGGALFGVRHYIIADKTPPGWLKPHLQSGRLKIRLQLKGLRAALLEDTQALPRLWRTSSWIQEKPEDRPAALKHRLQTGHNFFAQPVLEQELGISPHEGATGNAHFLKDDPEEILIETEGDHPGLLILSDSFSPGWRAQLNGEEVPILRANYIARAVQLPAGRAELRFEYRHPGLNQGILISLIALLLLLLLSLSPRLRRS